MTTRSLALSILLLISGARLVHAVVPDPGNIYYGLATDFLGNALVPESDAEVVMIRTENGNETVIAKSSIVDIMTPGGRVNYILRPVLDDGQLFRFNPAGARLSDSVRIYVQHNGYRFDINSEEDCIQVSDPVPALGPRGTVQRVNLRYLDDLDGDCMADSWEFLWFFTTEFNGSEDFDGDGMNNYAEFVAGTNPLLFDGPAFPLVIVDASIFLQQNTVTIQWESRPGKSYSVEWSGNLQSFERVPSSRFIAGQSNVIDVSGLPRRFFRVTEQ